MPNIIFSRMKIPKALFLASLDAAYNSEAKMYWAQALDPAGWGATVRILSFIGVTSKTMGPTIFEIKKFPKWLYLTSLDAARRLDAESLIREAWIILDQEIRPEYSLGFQRTNQTLLARSDEICHIFSHARPYKAAQLRTAQACKAATTLLYERHLQCYRA